jgi:hypothetical protein
MGDEGREGALDNTHVSGMGRWCHLLGWIVTGDQTYNLPSQGERLGGKDNWLSGKLGLSRCYQCSLPMSLLAGSPVKT